MDQGENPMVGPTQNSESILGPCLAKLNVFEAKVKAMPQDYNSKDAGEVLALSKGVLKDMHALSLEDSTLCQPMVGQFCSIMARAIEIASAKSEQGGLGKLCSKLFTPCIAAPGFLDVERDLRSLSEDARKAKRFSSGSSATATEAQRSLPDGTIIKPWDSAATETYSLSEEGVSLAQIDSWRTGTTSPSSPSQTGAVGDGVSAHGNRRIRKASRRGAVTAMAYVQPKDESNWKIPAGRVWMYIKYQVIGKNKFPIYDLRSGVEQQAEEVDNAGHVTAIHYSARGVIYTGHSCGSVVAWKEEDAKVFCGELRALNCAVCAITTDEADRVWAGNDKGEVRRLKIVFDAQNKPKLQKHRFLVHTGSGAPERFSGAKIDPETDMVHNLKAKEKAHEGAVAALAAASGRVWTTGGTSAFLSMKEWTQRGEFLKNHDLKSVGKH